MTALSLEPPAARRLQELKMPVLAVVGELDLPDFHEITGVICRQVPQAYKLVVPAAGHMANMEAPEQVLQAISAFLTQGQDSYQEK